MFFYGLSKSSSKRDSQEFLESFVRGDILGQRISHATSDSLDVSDVYQPFRTCGYNADTASLGISSSEEIADVRRPWNNLMVVESKLLAVRLKYCNVSGVETVNIFVGNNDENE